MPRRWSLIFRGFKSRRFRVAAWPRFLPHHTAKLLRWAEAHHRSFPWREATSPFAKLLGEMLLRKTSAHHARPAYTALIDLYPTPEALLEAAPKELEEILRPLGMVSHRVRGLQEMARFLVKRFGGQVPACPKELMKIPHVGRYTANAVCSFAFGLPLAIVDTNVLRVLQRFTSWRARGARPYTQPETWHRMARSLPEGQVDRFNYALLDLGATVCRPAPHCEVCPLTGGCVYARRAEKARPNGLAQQ